MRWAADLSDTKMKPYFYPDLDKSVLFEREYIMEKSGHTRGSTVDLTLFDMATEKELDMGGQSLVVLVGEAFEVDADEVDVDKEYELVAAE